MFFNKMARQIGLGVIFFVLAIEGLILITSYQSKKSELINLKVRLEKDVLKKTGEDFQDLHPDVFDDSHINELLDEFLRNVVILSIFIAIGTSLGTIFVFHNYVGKHILRLKRLNKLNRGIKVARWRANEIPNNEVGELILEREELLDRIERESIDE